MFTTLEIGAKHIVRSVMDHDIEPVVLHGMVCHIAPEKIAITAVLAELVKKNDVSKAVERLQTAFPEYNIREMMTIEQEVENAVFVVEQDYLSLPKKEDSGFVLV